MPGTDQLLWIKYICLMHHSMVICGCQGVPRRLSAGSLAIGPSVAEEEGDEALTLRTIQASALPRRRLYVIYMIRL